MATSGNSALLADVVDGLGYGDTLVRSHYPVWLGRTVQRLELVGFGRSAPQDLTTSTLVAERVRSDRDIERTFESARALASPAALIQRGDLFQLWSIAVDSERDQLVDEASSTASDRLIEKYRGVLHPRALLSAKTSGRQMSLFPIDVELLADAKQESASRLSSLVEDAVSSLMPSKSASEDELAASLVRASRTVIRALATLMLRDKENLQASTPLDLYRQASLEYPTYLEPLPSLDAVEDVFFALGEGVNYAGLNASLVSEVYENALVSRSERHDLGIFYTPMELARQLVAHVPMEELAPEDRFVLDPACGSGTLLLAAYDRLESLAPWGSDPGAEHQYLVEHLHGMDVDNFAVEIAKLSMLLRAIPNGNDWRIDELNSTSEVLPEKRRPSIIVTNPPWRDERSRDGIRRQVADDFLSWILDTARPNAFLGIILPSSWLTSNSSSEARRTLHERAEVFEVWRLPEGTFRSASLAPCAIFARVTNSTSSRPFLFKRAISSVATRRFLETGEPTEWWMSSPGADGSLLGGAPILRLPSMTDSPPLSDFATVQNGPVPEPPVAERGGSGDFLWLRRMGDLPAFGEPSLESLEQVRFPEDFHRAGRHDGSIFRSAKVLVSGKRAESNPWRLKVGMDRVGFIPRESIHMVIPRGDDDTLLFALFAILGSSLASWWIDSLNTKMAIEVDVLKSFPIVADAASLKRLAKLGRQLTEAAGSGPSLHRALFNLENTVDDIYGLTPELRKARDRHFAGFRAPEGYIRFPTHEPPGAAAEIGEMVSTFGAVLAMDDQTLTLWVPGITPDEGERVTTPARFIGWHCEPGSTFRVDIPPGGLKNGSFTFQSHSYEDIQNLLR